MERILKVQIMVGIIIQVQLSEKRVYLNFRDGEEFILRNMGR